MYAFTYFNIVNDCQEAETYEIKKDTFSDHVKKMMKYIPDDRKDFKYLQPFKEIDKETYDELLLLIPNLTPKLLAVVIIALIITTIYVLRRAYYCGN